LLFALLVCLAAAVACRGGGTEVPNQPALPEQDDPASIAMAAVEHVRLPPGFTLLRTDPLVQDGTPRGAFVTYANPDGETFSVGVSVEASADEATAQYERFVSFLDTLGSGGTPASLGGSFAQPPSGVTDMSHENLGPLGNDVTASGYILRYQQETLQELLAPPRVIAAFVSGNVWGRVDVGCRQGSALEEGAVNYAREGVLGAVGAVKDAAQRAAGFNAMEAFATAQAGSDRYPDVVARVNGVEILGKHLAARMAMIEVAPPGRQPRPSVQEALDAMIKEELWYQEAAARGLLCSEDEAKKAYEATFEGVDPAFLSQLAQYPNIDPEKIVDDPSKLPALERACATVNAKKAVFAEAGAAANGAEAAANVDRQKVLDDYIAAARQRANIEILLPAE